MGSKNCIISPIAIDMGAKNTGVYYTKYAAGATLAEVAKHGKQHGEVLVYDGYTSLLKERTTKRHIRRGYQRNKLAKRLLALVLKEYFDFPAEDHTQALGYLLNRRGYSFLEKRYNNEALLDFPDSAWNELSDEVQALLGSEKTKLGETLATLADNEPETITELVKKIDEIAANKAFQDRDKTIKDDYVYYDYLEKIKFACTLVAQGEIISDERLKKQGKKGKNDKKKLTKTPHWVINALKSPHITVGKRAKTSNLIRQIKPSNAAILKQQLPDIDAAIAAIKEREAQNNQSIWRNSTKFTLNDRNAKLLESGDKKTHLHHLCSAIYTIHQEIISGSRHRSKYFKAIQDDLKDLAELIKDGSHAEQEQQHKYLIDFAQAIVAHAQLNPDRNDHLHKLICHISNFELKPLRAYFNNPIQKSPQYQKDISNAISQRASDTFNLAKLSKLTATWFLRQWVVNIEKDNQEKVDAYQKLQEDWEAHADKDDIVAFWLKTAPELTIPPYQSMGNRHPPRCQSLLLNEAYLDKHYPDWQDWLTQLKLNADYGKKLGGLKNGKGTRALINQDAIQLRQLQFMLDTNRAIEPYKLNEIWSYHDKLQKLAKADGKENQQEMEQWEKKLAKAITQSALPEKLKQDLDFNEPHSFGHFINKYYKTRKRTREGRYFLHQSSKNKWLEENKLLRICPHKPRQKKYQLWEDLAAILNIDAETLKQIIASDEPAAIEEWFGKNITGEEIPEFKKVCDKAAKAQKEYRGELKRKTDYVQKHSQNGDEKKLNKVEKALLKITQNCAQHGQALAEKIWSDCTQEEQEKNAKKFNSVFSFAQIQNIVFEDRNGFSNTCPVCSTDNAFRRMQADQKDHANAARLPALSIRLIDGLVMRICDASSRHIAKKCWNNIKDDCKEVKEITIPLILEQNRFAFEPNLARLKDNIGEEAKQEEIKKRKAKGEQQYWDKRDRIKHAAQGICAYSGSPLGGDKEYEYDHIIPQASQYGRLNDEANLIYVSHEANQGKRNQAYFLPNLNTEYKNTIFGTSCDDAIETYIYHHLAGEGATAAIISDNDNFYFGRYLSFINLTEEQKIAFRHALFLADGDPLRQKVIRALQNRNRTIVNGTQRYMAQCIADKLYKIAKKHKREKQLKFDYFEYPAHAIQDLRRFYAKQDPDIEKSQEKQTLYSHLIDAQMAFLLAADEHKNNGSMGLQFLAAETIKAGIDEASGEIIANKFYRASAIAEKSDKYEKIDLQPKSTSEKIGQIEKYHPNRKVNVAKICTRYIFKENAIGERYKPIVEYGGQIYIGYPQARKGGDYDCESYCEKITKYGKILQAIITQAKYYKLTRHNENIKIYTINKENQYRVIDKDSHKYFSALNQAYSEADKQDIAQINFINKHCQYYVAKTELIDAPHVIEKEENQKLPLHKAWVDFDQAWRKALHKAGKDYKTRPVQEKRRYDIDEVQDTWDNFCKKQLHIVAKEDAQQKGKHVHKNSHAKVRKNFSMTAVTSISTVLRIKRMNRQQQDIYQAVSLDNRAGDNKPPANFLIKHSKNLTRVSKAADKELKKPIPRSIKGKTIAATRFFTPEFFTTHNIDATALEVVANSTAMTVKNFPLTIFKNYLNNSDIASSDLDGNKSIKILTQNKSEKALLDNPDAIVAQKTKVDGDIVITTKADKPFKDIKITGDTITFSLTFERDKIAKIA